MTEHYYTRQPHVQHEIKQIHFSYQGKTYPFYTDAGVFSKDRVDYGTQLLIKNMKLPIDAKVLDIGCGYGVIGIVAADMAVKGTVKMIDINERAVEIANRNIILNGIDNAAASQANVFEGLERETFDCILTNPPIRAGKQIVHQILEQSYKYMSSGGALWVVIQKKQGAESAQKKLEEIFQDVEIMDRSKGYRILRARKNEGV